jgi:hypothetical protein
VLLGKPWIELTELSPLRQQFTNGSLIHAARGMELAASDHYDLAAQSFERALASDLPERVKIELERLLRESLERTSRPIELPEKKKRGSSDAESDSGSQEEE